MPRKNPSSSLQAANNSSFIYHKLWQPQLFLKKNEDLCATALSRDPQTRSGLDFGTQETTSKQLLTTNWRINRSTATHNGVTCFLKEVIVCLLFLECQNIIRSSSAGPCSVQWCKDLHFFQKKMGLPQFMINFSPLYNSYKKI